MRGVVGHLGERGEAEIGLAEMGGRRARARHVDAAKARGLDEPRGEPIVGTRGDDEPGLVEHLAKTRAGPHWESPFPGPQARRR